MCRIKKSPINEVDGLSGGYAYDLLRKVTHSVTKRNTLRKDPLCIQAASPTHYSSRPNRGRNVTKPGKTTNHKTAELTQPTQTGVNWWSKRICVEFDLVLLSRPTKTGKQDACNTVVVLRQEYDPYQGTGLVIGIL